jgi:hypothetical protein
VCESVWEGVEGDRKLEHTQVGEFGWVGGQQGGLTSQAEVGEGRWEAVDGMLETITHAEVSEGGWKRVDGEIKHRLQGEVGEGGREVVYISIKFGPKSKKSEVVGEVVHSEVKQTISGENKVGERGREVVDWVVELKS